MSMKVLVESNFKGVHSETVDKKVFLTGIFAEAQLKNRNGRIYRLDEIKATVDKFNQAAMDGRHILGALDHPTTLEIRLETVSHKILNMRMEGNNALGKLEILSTPAGNIARTLIESGIQLGVSTRGSGEVNESTGDVTGFDCVTIDLVAQPSAINAYPSTVMEQLECYKHRNRVYDMAEIVKHDPLAQKYLQKEINTFLQEIFK